MRGQRSAGVLWLIAGISSGGISFFLVDPLDLAIFIGGAVLAILLGLAMLARPSPAWVLASASSALPGSWRLERSPSRTCHYRSRNSCPSSGCLRSAWLPPWSPTCAAEVALGAREPKGMRRFRLIDRL